MSSSKKGIKDRFIASITTKRLASFFSGVALAVAILIVIFSLMNEGITMLPDSGELVIFLGIIGLSVGFKTVHGMKTSIDTFLLPVGFFIALFIEMAILAYFQIGNAVWFGVGAFGFFFLFSALLVYSEQIEERETLEDVIQFLSDRLSWGLVGYYILSTFLRPSLPLLFEQWQSGTIDATIASTTLFLGAIVIGMFTITLGIFNSKGLIRRQFHWGKKEGKGGSSS